MNLILLSDSKSEDSDYTEKTKLVLLRKDFFSWKSFFVQFHTNLFTYSCNASKKFKNFHSKVIYMKHFFKLSYSSMVFVLLISIFNTLFEMPQHAPVSERRYLHNCCVGMDSRIVVRLDSHHNTCPLVKLI